MAVIIQVFTAGLLLVLTLLATTRQGRAFVGSAIGMIVPWTQELTVQYLPRLAALVANTITRIMVNSRGVFMALVANFASDITGEEVDLDIAPGSTFTGGLAQFGRRMTGIFGRAVQDTLAPARALSPEDARDQVNALLGMSGTLQLQSWWGHALSELATIGRFRYISEFSGAIERGFGFNTLGRSVSRRLFALGVSEPLGVYYNQVYQPTRLTTSQAIDAWQKDLIDDNDALAILRANGYRHDRSLLLMNLAQRDFSLDQAERLWRSGRLSEGQLEQIVRRQGYGEVRGELVHQLVVGERTEKILEDLADTARRAYRNGQLDQGELREFLTEANYRNPEIDLILVREALERKQEKQLSKAEVMEAYREGILDEFETRDRLRALNYDSEEIDILIATQQKRLSPAQVIDALARGIIDESAARRRLSQLGYRDEDIELLLDLRVRRLTLGQVIDALARNLLNVSDARDQLRRLGFDAEAIELLLAFQRRELSAGDIQAAVLRGLISEGEALLRLERLGYKREDAQLILRLRFQLLSSGQVLDAYEGGRLTRRETVDRLKVLGFTSEDAELIVTRFEDKMIREGKRKPPAS